MKNFSRKQWIVLIILVLCKFLSTIVWSLQAPFYPKEVEKKNGTVIESGIVLGTYELMVFTLCPLISTQVPRIGTFETFHIGFSACGLSTICFGFLDLINNRAAFIGCSVALRILEAGGASAIFLSTYTICNKLYPRAKATVFSIIESTFAVSAATGPLIGGLLYEVGDKFGHGFTLPFVTVGSAMLLLCILTYVTLPRDSDLSIIEVQKKNLSNGTVPDTVPQGSLEEEDASSLNFGFIELLKIKRIILYTISAMCISFAVGFLTATLEPRIREFGLTPLQTGVMFFIYGGVYASTAFLWGILCDRSHRPDFAALGGSTIVLVSFIFLGPLPFIPLVASVSSTFASLALFGLGMGGIYVSVYSLLLREASLNGFPESSKTSALIAGLWMEGISLGAFIGPIVGGILLEYFGFENATLSVAIIFSILTLVLSFTSLIRLDGNVPTAQQENSNVVIPSKTVLSVRSLLQQMMNSVK